MDAKLDKDGDLWLKRAGKWKLQACPYSSADRMCGDHCGLFAEMEWLHDDGSPWPVVQPRPKDDEKETPEKELDK